MQATIFGNDETKKPRQGAVLMGKVSFSMLQKTPSN